MSSSRSLHESMHVHKMLIPHLSFLIFHHEVSDGHIVTVLYYIRSRTIATNTINEFAGFFRIVLNCLVILLAGLEK